jgi:hypothetical protein
MFTPTLLAIFKLIPSTPFFLSLNNAQYRGGSGIKISDFINRTKDKEEPKSVCRSSKTSPKEKLIRRVYLSICHYIFLLTLTFSFLSPSMVFMAPPLCLFDQIKTPLFFPSFRSLQNSPSTFSDLHLLHTVPLD